MKTELIYVELKTGFEHNGPAWIGNVFFSKSKTTIYFNGQILQKGNMGSGNYFNIETRDAYWVSGIKKDGTDRHAFGTGRVQIDESVVEQYLLLTKQTSLNKSQFEVVQLNNIPAKSTATEILNKKLY